jgi:hypothetical protein
MTYVIWFRDRIPESSKCLPAVCFQGRHREFETDSRTPSALWRLCMSLRDVSESRRDEMSPYRNRDTYCVVYRLLAPNASRTRSILQSLEVKAERDEVLRTLVCGVV